MSYIALTLPGGQTIQPPAGISDASNASIGKIISNAISIMLIVTVILALIYLILGGITWITSGGDKSKVETARKRLTFAVVGLVIALGAFFIISIISYIFNINLLNTAL
jgi:Type IV secretion system pilin